MLAKPAAKIRSVAWRQGHWRGFNADFDRDEDQFTRIVAHQERYPLVEFGRRPHQMGLLEADCAGHGAEIDAAAGMGPLHAGFGIVFIVDHHDRQV